MNLQLGQEIDVELTYETKGSIIKEAKITGRFLHGEDAIEKNEPHCYEVSFLYEKTKVIIPANMFQEKTGFMGDNSVLAIIPKKDLNKYNDLVKIGINTNN